MNSSDFTDTSDSSSSSGSENDTKPTSPVLQTIPIEYAAQPNSILPASLTACVPKSSNSKETKQSSTSSTSCLASFDDTDAETMIGGSLEAKKGGLVKGEKKTDQVSTEIDDSQVRLRTSTPSIEPLPPQSEQPRAYSSLENSPLIDPLSSTDDDELLTKIHGLILRNNKLKTIVKESQEEVRSLEKESKSFERMLDYSLSQIVKLQSEVKEVEQLKTDRIQQGATIKLLEAELQRSKDQAKKQTRTVSNVKVEEITMNHSLGGAGSIIIKGVEAIIEESA